VQDRSFPIDTERIEAVVFDLGGVLIEGGPSEVIAFGERAGLDEDHWRTLRREIFGNGSMWAGLERGEVSYEDFVQELHRRVVEAGGNLSLEDAAFFMGRPEPMGEQSPVRPAMVDAVRQLRKRLPTALLTNNVAEWRDGWSVLFKDPELFEVVVDSSEVGARKPEPKIYEITREKLDVEHEAILFVDDIGQNLKAAKQLGWQTLLFTDEAAVLPILEGIYSRP
jgi:putative hydrolase of the HAD superfamily